MGDLEKNTVKFYKEIFSKTRITKKFKNILLNFVFSFLNSEQKSGICSGVIIAGFGKNELFPHIREYIIDGRSNYYEKIFQVTNHDMNDDKKPTAFIKAFAQSDIMSLLIEGISENYIKYIFSTIEQILHLRVSETINKYVISEDEKIVEKSIQDDESKKIINKFFLEFEKHRRKQLVHPILDVVNALPREEMAAMAEAMIEITSLRRRIDSKTETVGGPVDVAVISKGDGVIWIKRKHYFDIALNQDFLYRKHMKGWER